VAFAGSFPSFSLNVTDQTAPPGGTLTWSLTVDNLTGYYVVFDNLTWCCVNPSDGSATTATYGTSASVAPTTDYTEPSAALTVNWLLGATPGYSLTETLLIQYWLCTDALGDGCTTVEGDPLADSTLQPEAAVSPLPEPATLPLLLSAIGCLAFTRRKLR
jgi:hypothetical protein